MYRIPSSGSKGTPTYFVYFPWPPLQVGLSISTFRVSFIRVKEGLVSYYIHAAYDRLYLTEISQHQTLIGTVLNIF